MVDAVIFSIRYIGYEILNIYFVCKGVFFKSIYLKFTEFQLREPISLKIKDFWLQVFVYLLHRMLVLSLVIGYLYILYQSLGSLVAFNLYMKLMFDHRIL